MVKAFNVWTMFVEFAKSLSRNFSLRKIVFQWLLWICCRVASNQFQRVLNCNAYQHQPRGYPRILLWERRNIPICYSSYSSYSSYSMLQINFTSTSAPAEAKPRRGYSKRLVLLQWSHLPWTREIHGAWLNMGTDGGSRDWWRTSSAPDPRNMCELQTVQVIPRSSCRVSSFSPFKKGTRTRTDVASCDFVTANSCLSLNETMDSRFMPFMPNLSRPALVVLSERSCTSRILSSCGHQGRRTVPTSRYTVAELPQCLGSFPIFPWFGPKHHVTMQFPSENLTRHLCHLVEKGPQHSQLLRRQLLSSFSQLFNNLHMFAACSCLII